MSVNNISWLNCSAKMGYSKEEKFDVVRIYYANRYNVKMTRQEYRLSFPNRQTPSINTIRNIIKQFRESKSLERKRRTVPESEDDLNILLYFQGKFS